MSAKTIFQRAPHETWKSYLPETEIFIYHNFYMRPTLSQILQPGKEYLIFLSAEIEFHKLTDINDKMSIFSSYRNQRWISVDHNSLAVSNRYADEMLTNFSIQIMSDIDSVQNKKESGWVYEKVIKMSIVKIERNILLGPSFGATPRRNKKPYSFNKHFQTTLKTTNLRIPDNYIPYSFSKHPNICIPLAIVIKLEHIRAGGLFSRQTLSLRRMASALHNLRFKELQTVENDFKIYKKDLPKLEEINKGFGEALKQQYPFLRLYDGFSLNMYRVLGLYEAHKGGTVRLTTSHLSENWNSSKFLQIDLLDATDILDPPVTDHVLIILNYIQLVSHRKDTRYKHACRACQRLFSKYDSFLRHITEICSPSPTAPRRAKNFILHKTFIKDKQTGKKKPHTVSFQHRQYHKTFQSLVYGTMDLESTNKTMEAGLFHKKPPSSSIFYQKPFAFSLCYTTPYNILLPDNLNNITIKFYDERYTTLDTFYLSILTTLRQNVADVNKFIFNTITQDNGPPNLSSLSKADREAYMKASSCSFCGRKFNSKIRSKKNKNLFFTLRKVKHHNHFIKVPNLAKKGSISEDNGKDRHEVIVLCSGCNVNTYQSGFLTKNDLRIGIHNGGKYDFIFLSDMVSRVGHTPFKQIDKNGQEITLPLIKGDVQVLCKDKNSFLQLSLRFNCDHLSTCPYHSQNNLSSTHTKKNRWSSCPYEKSVTFFDTAMMITASLDGMLQDVRNIHEGVKDLRLVFPRTHHFITSQMGYNEEVFSSVLCKKIPQPFEKIDSLQYALDMKEPPPVSHFFSRLKGDALTGEPSISEESYNDFVSIWRQIGATNYFDILVLYSGADSTILADVISFYYGEIFRVSGLSAIEFVTCASISYQSALLNSKSPYNANEPLQLHVPNRKIHDIYALGLRGGYAFVNANYCEFRHLEVNRTNSVPRNMIKQLSFEDINGLYASLLKQRISIGDYVFYSRRHNKQQFDFLSRQLLSMNIDFFSNEMHMKNHLFFFVVILTYDDDALFAPQNFDLSFFPFYDTISLDMLSPHQSARAQRLKRDPGRESCQLVSYLKRGLKTADYAENLIYQLSFHNCKISRVVKIVRSTAFPVFNPWLSRLETEKRRNISPILNKLWKQFGNNIAGYTHQRLNERVSAKLCLSKASFVRHTNSEHFFDFTFINENACLLTFDHKSIVSRNLPAISSRTYSSAKLFMWRMYHTLAARFYFFGGYGTRILMSDTDSYAISMLTKKCDYMLAEAEKAKQAGLSHLPFSSYTSRFIANAYLKTMAPFLDFSCINPDSHIYQTFFADSTPMQKACATLAKNRRSQSFYIKSEINNKQMEMFLAASVKMYMIVNKDLSPSLIKAKGLKRGLISKVIDTAHFIDVAKHEKPSKTVQQYNLKRMNGTIFLHSVKRRALTLFTSKRIMDPTYFQPGSHFGYPLHFKPFM